MAINRLLQGSLQSGLPKFDTLWDGRSAVGSMEPISSITLTSAQFSVQFNNIPQTYSHLQLRGFILGDAIGASTNQRLNDDFSGTNYYCHRLIGNGSAATAGAFANQMYFPNTGGTTTPAAAVIDYLDYTNTSKYKTIRALEGIDNNSTDGFISFWSGLWSSTAAISTITLSLPTTNYRAGSVFTLYGIK